MQLNTDLAAYYAKRAATYDQKYARPERMQDLESVRDWLRTMLAQRHVLELNCGTGYWTADVAQVAASVLPTDHRAPLLELAKAKKFPANVAEFVIDDVASRSIDHSATPLDTVFAAHWWSHVLRQDQDSVLTDLRRRVPRDAMLVLVDNAYVEGSSASIARTDLQSNTFQIRTLDGERFEVLKNFPSDSTLRKRFAAHLKDIRIRRVEHFWMLSGRLK